MAEVPARPVAALRALESLAWFSSMITVLFGIAMVSRAHAAGRSVAAAAFALYAAVGFAGAAAAFGVSRGRSWGRPVGFAAFGVITAVHLVGFALYTTSVEALRLALNAAILTLLVRTSPPPAVEAA